MFLAVDAVGIRRVVPGLCESSGDTTFVIALLAVLGTEASITGTAVTAEATVLLAVGAVAVLDGADEFPPPPPPPHADNTRTSATTKSERDTNDPTG